MLHFKILLHYITRIQLLLKFYSIIVLEFCYNSFPSSYHYSVALPEFHFIMELFTRVISLYVTKMCHITRITVHYQQSITLALMKFMTAYLVLISKFIQPLCAQI